MEDIIPTTEGENTTGRIALYINLSMNNQDAFYANDLVYKGKPLYIEFPVKYGETPNIVAKRVKAIADKYLLFTAQEKILDVIATVTNTAGSEAGTVTFKGVNGYQMITKASLQKYDPTAKTVDCCTTQGEYVDVITGVPVIFKIGSGLFTKDDNEKQYYLDEDGNITEIGESQVAILPGLEAFGDYNWIIHNLRLPTAANTNFWAPTKNEMPMVGTYYTQFIIKLATNRDGIAGEAVGQRVTSVTTHVLYVAGNLGPITNGQATSGTPAALVYNQLATLISGSNVTISSEAATKRGDPYHLIGITLTH
jgi:hypothetical protein